jgi:hypothetical protein
MRMKTIIIGLLILISLAGCSAGNYLISTLKQASPNENYSVSLKPVSLAANNLYNGMAISITNKTEKPIEIVWNKTYYFDHGKTNGGLVLKEADYEQMNNPKSNDIVSGKSTYDTVVYPLNLVKGCNVSALGSLLGGYTSAPKQQCYHVGFREGENGIDLTLLVNGEEMNEILTFNVSLEPRS